MKTNVLKTQLVMTTLQLALPISTLSDRRVITTDRVFPEMRERRRCFCQVTEEIDAAHALLISARFRNVPSANAVRPAPAIVSHLRFLVAQS